MNPLIEAVRSFLKTEESEKALRDTIICAMFLEGRTLSDIGRPFNISRERVRQILEANNITKDMGGRIQRSRNRGDANAQKAQEAREARANRFYGCSASDVDSINNGLTWHNRRAPSKLYFQQRRSAVHRGIQWNFTLPEWWKVWSESGKWGLRGRGTNGYCMTRKNDSGGYEPGNVQIKTNKENIQESWSVERAELRRAVRLRRDIQKAIKAFELKEQGYSAKKIAFDLGISEGIVYEYVNNGERHLKEAK